MVQLNFKKTGEGPPMVILHGLLGSLDNWQTLAKMFGHYYTVYTVDQRNHGQSPHTDDISYALMAGDLRNFLQEHDIQRPILMGHSMGGKTVMHLALEHTEDLASLVVIDMSPKAYAVHHDKILNALAKVDFDVVRSRREAEEMLLKELKDPGLVYFLTKNIYWESQDRLGYRFNLQAIRNAIGDLSDWVGPDSIYKEDCLFVRGGKSDYILDDEPSLFRLFPHATLHTIPDAGHWVHAEQQQAFYEVVLNYLQSHL